MHILRFVQLENVKPPTLYRPIDSKESDRFTVAQYVDDMVENTLDLTPTIRSYSGRGKPAQCPKMLAKTMIYAAIDGVFSARAIELKTQTDSVYKYLAGNTQPDHSTILRFRKRFFSTITLNSENVRQYAKDMNVLKAKNIAVDGTVMEANASIHSALSHGYINKNIPIMEKDLQDFREISENFINNEPDLAKIESKTNEIKNLVSLLNDNNTKDKPDILMLQEKNKILKNTINLAITIKNNENKKNGVKNIQEEIQRRVKKLDVYKRTREAMQKRHANEYQQKIQKYNKDIDTRNKLIANNIKPDTPYPKKPSPEIEDKYQMNLTDPDSIILPAKKGGGCIQGFKIEGGVDMDSLIVVYDNVSQQINDYDIPPKIADHIQEHNHTKKYNYLSEVETVVGDNGLCSRENVLYLDRSKITPLFSPGRERNYRDLDKVCAQNLDTTQLENPENDPYKKMLNLFEVVLGKELYSKRKTTIETIFGCIKGKCMNWTKMSMRGLLKVRQETSFIFMVWNIRRLFTIQKVWGVKLPFP